MPKIGLFPRLAMLLLFAIPALTQQTCTNQSPRNVTIKQDSPKRVPYNYVAQIPLVTRIEADWPDKIYYQKQTLSRCDQHYHAPVENIQGCDGEKPGAAESEATPPAGQWIEVHTVYALEVSDSPDCADRLDHGLSCCKKPPFVVVAYSAKIAADQPPPNPPVLKPPTAALVSEWTGSTTGKKPDDPPDACKPVPAQWNFVLGCNFTVPRNHLARILPHAHLARDLQPEARISRDLTLAGPLRDIAPLTCKYVSAINPMTGLAWPIGDNATAKKVCPVVCRNTLTVTDFTGAWNPGRQPQCECCTPYRPQ